jgi:hypothetical protein
MGGFGGANSRQKVVVSGQWQGIGRGLSTG